MLSIDQIEPLKFTPEVDVEAITVYKKDLLAFVDALSHVPNYDKPQLKRYYSQILYQKWAPILAVNPDHIASDIHELLYPPISVRSEYTVQTALEREDVGASWLVAGLLPKAGLQLLGAAPKAGKSVFLYMLAYSIAVSGSFLGLPCKKGRVLFIQAEEPDDLISQRLRLAGFGSWDIDINDPQIANSVTIWRKFDALDPQDIAKLQDRLSRDMFDVVFMDSLRKLTHKQEINENSGEMGRIVYTLQDVFSQTNKAGILIHHMKKPTGNGNQAKQSLVHLFSGHSSITAAPDGLLGLFSNEKDGDVCSVVLKTLQREGIPLTVEYERTISDEGLWVPEVLSTTSILGDSTLLLKLLRIIKNAKHPQGASLKEIAEVLKIQSADSTLHSNISRLQSLRIVLSNITIDDTDESKRMLRYQLAKDSEWLISNDKLQNAVNKLTNDAEMLIACNSRTEVRKLTGDWDVKRKKQVLDSFAPHEKESILERLFNTPEYVQGQIVMHNGSPHKIVDISDETHLFRTHYVLDNGVAVLEQHLTPASLENDDDIDLGL